MVLAARCVWSVVPVAAQSAILLIYAYAATGPLKAPAWLFLLDTHLHGDRQVQAGPPAATLPAQRNANDAVPSDRLRKTAHHPSRPAFRPSSRSAWLSNFPDLDERAPLPSQWFPHHRRAILRSFRAGTIHRRSPAQSPQDAARPCPLAKPEMAPNSSANQRLLPGHRNGSRDRAPENSNYSPYN